MSKHNTNCCVYGCNSRMGANPPKTIHFHRFPKPGSNKITIVRRNGIREVIDRRIAWEKALLRIQPATTHMRVCSKHFKQTDYINAGLTSTAPRLKLNSVPSLNLPKLLPVSKLKEKMNNHYYNSFNLSRAELEKKGQLKKYKDMSVNTTNYNKKCEKPNVSNESKRLLSSLSEKEKMAISGLLTLTLISGGFNKKCKR